ncbi:MAG TPA: DUF2721 domain-containing protein, partial [Duganella sp.]
PLDKYIAGMFVVAMGALIGSFCYLLREIFIASAAMRSHRHVRRAPANAPTTAAVK